MSAAISVLLLSLVSTALGADMASAPIYDSKLHPRDYGTQPSTAYLAPTMGEQPGALQQLGQTRMIWRKKDSFHKLIAASVTIAATLAVAFMVVQCFKAIGKSYKSFHSARRLGQNNPGYESEDECRDQDVSSLLGL
ncbi:hypothetical protein Emed_001317 [Eimeria media]